ncbi:MAG: CsgG/HfaB family protein [Planctomycetota bacterium]
MTRNLLVGALVCAILVLVLPGCMGFGGSEAIKKERVAGEVAGPDKLDQWDTFKWPAFNGPKKRIAVGEVTDASGNAQGAALAKAARAEMENVIFATHRFVLLERADANVKGMLNEQDMAAAGMTVATSAPAAGKMLGASFYIDASVTQLQDNAGGGQVGGIGANSNNNFGGFVIGGKRCEATVQVKIRDNQTGQIIATFNGKGYDSKASFGVAQVKVNDNTATAAGLGSYANTNLGRALRRGVCESVLKIVNTLGKEPWKGAIVEITDGKIAIKGGKDMNLVPGMRMKVLHKIKEIVDPETQESLGFDTEEIATVVIDRVLEKASFAKCESGSLDNAQVGDFLNMIEVAPVPAGGTAPAGASQL